MFPWKKASILILTLLTATACSDQRFSSISNTQEKKDENSPSSEPNPGPVIDPEGVLSFKNAPVVEVKEDLSQDTTLTVTFELIEPITSSVAVDYATSNGSAKDSHDYLAAAGTLTLSAGQSSFNLDLVVRNDQLFDSQGTESFFLDIYRHNENEPLVSATVKVKDGHRALTVLPTRIQLDGQIKTMSSYLSYPAEQNLRFKVITHECSNGVPYPAVPGQHYEAITASHPAEVTVAASGQYTSSFSLQTYNTVTTDSHTMTVCFLYEQIDY